MWFCMHAENVQMSNNYCVCIEKHMAVVVEYATNFDDEDGIIYFY